MGSRARSRAGRRKKTPRSTQARRADKYDLYQQAVQETEPDIDLVERIFRHHFRRRPHLLREDFCGTALLACDWVRRHEENRAWAIDLDPEPLAWGREHNLSRLSPEEAGRVKLIEGDVRDIGHDPVDVTIAFNFSYFLFESRAALRDYFRRALGTLRPEGLLVLDAYGGADAQRTSEETREVEGFDYVWDQHRYDPISGCVTNFIHFEFSDGSRLRRAFRYDWRLWSLPELRELLQEAGFGAVEVYWEGTDGDTGEGNGVFTRRSSAPDDPAWVSYLAAVKKPSC